MKIYELRLIFAGFVPKGSIDYIPALVQIMAWRRSVYLCQQWCVSCLRRLARFLQYAKRGPVVSLGQAGVTLGEMLLPQLCWNGAFTFIVSRFTVLHGC